MKQPQTTDMTKRPGANPVIDQTSGIGHQPGASPGIGHGDQTFEGGMKPGNNIGHGAESTDK